MSYYLFLFDLFALARVVTYWHEGRPTWKRVSWAAAAEIVTLFTAFPWSGPSAWAASVLTLGTCLSAVAEPSAGGERDGRRFAIRLALLVGVAALLAAGAIAPAWRPGLQSIGTAIGRHLLIGPALHRIGVRRSLARVAALLLCTGEANGVLRLTLLTFGIHPKSNPADLRHYRQGGLIGVIERILVLIFAANNAYNAVGFILTAKGLVRFGEMAAKEDAEYILVGTLVSTSLAIGVALLLPHLAG